MNDTVLEADPVIPDNLTETVSSLTHMREKLDVVLAHVRSKIDEEIESKNSEEGPYSFLDVEDEKIKLVRLRCFIYEKAAWSSREYFPTAQQLDDIEKWILTGMSKKGKHLQEVPKE